MDSGSRNGWVNATPCRSFEMKHAEIKIILVGTEGQPDKPESEFRVRYLEDYKEIIGGFLQEMNQSYPNFGWTLFTGHKILSEEEAR